MSQSLEAIAKHKAEFNADSIVTSITRVLENSSDMKVIANCCNQMQVTTPNEAKIKLKQLVWGLFKREQGIDMPDAEAATFQPCILNRRVGQICPAEVPGPCYANTEQEMYYQVAEVADVCETSKENSILNKSFIEYDSDFSNDYLFGSMHFHAQGSCPSGNSADLDLFDSYCPSPDFSSTPIDQEPFVDCGSDVPTLYRDPFLTCERSSQGNFNESIEVSRQRPAMLTDSLEDFYNLGQSWDSLKFSSLKDNSISDASINFSRPECLNESQLLLDMYKELELSVDQNSCTEDCSRNFSPQINEIFSSNVSCAPSGTLANEALSLLNESMRREFGQEFISEPMDCTSPDSTKIGTGNRLPAEPLKESTVRKYHSKTDSSLITDENNCPSENLLNVGSSMAKATPEDLPSKELVDIALKHVEESIRNTLENVDYSQYEVHDSDSDDSVKVLYDFGGNDMDLAVLGLNNELGTQEINDNRNLAHVFSENQISISDGTIHGHKVTRYPKPVHRMFQTTIENDSAVEEVTELENCVEHFSINPIDEENRISLCNRSNRSTNIGWFDDASELPLILVVSESMSAKTTNQEDFEKNSITKGPLEMCDQLEEMSNNLIDSKYFANQSPLALDINYLALDQSPLALDINYLALDQSPLLLDNNSLSYSSNESLSLLQSKDSDSDESCSSGKQQIADPTYCKFLSESGEMSPCVDESKYVLEKQDKDDSAQSPVRPTPVPVVPLNTSLAGCLDDVDRMEKGVLLSSVEKSVVTDSSIILISETENTSISEPTRRLLVSERTSLESVRKASGNLSVNYNDFKW